MARRKFREQKSKFYGTKQVLQDINLPAHGIVHDLDVTIGGGTATGYTLFWTTNTILRVGDISNPIYVPAAATLTVCYASLPVPAVNTFEVDIYLNGSTIFTTSANRPKVTAGNQLSADAVPDITTINPRDVLEVEILSTGENYGRAMVYIVAT